MCLFVCSCIICSMWLCVSHAVFCASRPLWHQRRIFFFFNNCGANKSKLMSNCCNLRENWCDFFSKNSRTNKNNSLICSSHVFLIFVFNHAFLFRPVFSAQQCSFLIFTPAVNWAPRIRGRGPWKQPFTVYLSWTWATLISTWSIGLARRVCKCPTNTIQVEKSTVHLHCIHFL